MSDSKILVTGSTGFLGRGLVDALLEKKIPIRAVTRNKKYMKSIEEFLVPEIDGEVSWIDAFTSIGCVIHCAARAHIMNEEVLDPISEYRRVNVDGTLNLARQASESGVKRFIYISSIKVNGESTTGICPFSEEDEAKSRDPYGISKYEAEEGLKRIAFESSMEVVIIRPPLVYGAGVKANFLNLLKFSSTKLPLPFGLVRNKRSMVYIENLVDFIVKCIDHPAAANQTFLVSDNDDLSLRSLLVMIRESMKIPVRLLPTPVFLFKLAGLILGKKDVVDRLVGDLQVNPNKAMTLLDWEPPYTAEQGIQATVDSFLKDKK